MFGFDRTPHLPSALARVALPLAALAALAASCTGSAGGGTAGTGGHGTGGHGTGTGTHGTGGGTGCTVNADCAAMGQYQVCRQTKCVSLVTDLCTTVHTSTSPASAAYLDDTAVIFGSILPTAANADAPYGHLLEDSIKLALDDFGVAGGIPGLAGGKSRPLVLVGCNDGVNEDRTDEAAKHLVNDLGVPAIIGYAFSGNTIAVAEDVTIPGGVLLVSPSATSAAITQLQGTDKDLVWRTAPSDDLQAQAMTLYYPHVAAAVKARYPGVDASKLRVGVAHHSDAYGTGLFSALKASLGSTVNLVEYDYGMPQNPNLGEVPTIVADAPHILFVLGFNEGPDQIFTQVESQWAAPADGHRPFWVFSDGGEVPSLWASSPMKAADLATDDQRQRVSGTVPGVGATSWPPYATFLTEFMGSMYASDGSPDTLGPAGAYDSLYLLAYSAVMVGDNPLTGPNLVKFGLGEMRKTPGLTKIQINRANILTTFPQLTAGMPVDVTGVSGPLPFDGKGDLTTSDIQIWCVPPGTPPSGDVGAPAIVSGYYFDSTNNVMAGCANLATRCGFTMAPACP